MATTCSFQRRCEQLLWCKSLRDGQRHWERWRLTRKKTRIFLNVKGCCVRHVVYRFSSSSLEHRNKILWIIVRSCGWMVAIVFSIANLSKFFSSMLPVCSAEWAGAVKAFVRRWRSETKRHFLALQNFGLETTPCSTDGASKTKTALSNPYYSWFYGNRRRKSIRHMEEDFKNCEDWGFLPKFQVHRLGSLRPYPATDVLY